jgi:hypothetical protein
MTVNASQISVPFDIPQDCDLEKIQYESGKLEITVFAPNGNEVAYVTFEYVEGFRVLDEGNLLEFWPTCSRPNGWIYQINNGGWLNQESERDGFLVNINRKVFSEYFVIGADKCVNVLSGEPPIVTSPNE